MKYMEEYYQLRYNTALLTAIALAWCHPADMKWQALLMVLAGIAIAMMWAWCRERELERLGIAYGVLSVIVAGGSFVMGMMPLALYILYRVAAVALILVVCCAGHELPESEDDKVINALIVLACLTVEFAHWHTAWSPKAIYVYLAILVAAGVRHRMMGYRTLPDPEKRRRAQAEVMKKIKQAQGE